MIIFLLTTSSFGDIILEVGGWGWDRKRYATYLNKGDISRNAQLFKLKGIVSVQFKERSTTKNT